jgi:hypothetical protein
MELNLTADLKELEQRAFNLQKQQAALLTDLHELLARPDCASVHEWLFLLRTWILSTYSLWAPDVIGMAQFVCKQVRATGQIDPKLISVLRKMRAMPNEEVQEMVSENEHAMAVGDFNWCLTDSAQGKYAAAEKQVIADPALKADWEQFNRDHNVALYRNSAGIVRRRMDMERNFRTRESKFRWETDEDKFRVDFDVLCNLYSLHGFEGEKPLLQKLCVYATPRGLTIELPRWWSLDFRRDLKMSDITRLLKAWGSLRQGEKMSVARVERTALQRRARHFAAAAEKQKLTGLALLAYVRDKVKMHPDTELRVVRRLLGKPKKQK